MAYTYIIGIGICLILLIAIGVWFFLRYRKKKKIESQLANNIPQEVLEDFQEAERRIKTGAMDGKTPYNILWDIARERNRKYNLNQANEKEVIQNGEGRRTKQGRSDNGGSYKTEPTPRTTTEDIRGDRELKETRNIQLQSNIDTPKEQQDTGRTKRSPKKDWVSFD